MKKFFLVFSLILMLISMSFFAFKSAYEEWSMYSELTERANKLLVTFQELSSQLTKAAVINPDLLAYSASQTESNLFYTDSVTVAETLTKLNNLVRDSVNKKIAAVISLRLQPELGWIVRSNVPDSLIHKRALTHVTNLKIVDQLISQGKERTKFVLAKRKIALELAFEKVIQWVVVTILLSFVLLLFTLVHLFKQLRTRKEKEIEFSIKESRFHLILDNMLEGVQIHDFNWKCIYANNSIANYFKISKNELLGKTLDEIFPGIEDQDWIDILEKCMVERCSEQLETTITFTDGRKADFKFSIQPVPEGLFILSTDITKRKNTERDLKRTIDELAKFRYAVDESSIVAITDQQGIIRHVNDYFCRISGYSAAELIGKDHRLINSGYHSKDFIRNLWTTIANGKIWQGEIRNKTKEGTFYWVATTIVPFLNEAGKPYQYLAMRSDISERKQAEEKLYKTNRLYKFISSINKSIVHIKNEAELLDNSSRIATEIGAFKLAYITMLGETGKLSVKSLSGDQAMANSILQRSGLDPDDPDVQNTLAVKALKTGVYQVCNDMQNDPSLSSLKNELIEHEICASIALPLFKFGKVSGIFAFHSTVKNFFDEEEIALLEEAAGDISFAIENYERIKKHDDTEALVIKNEKRFRGLIEKSSDMKTLTNEEGKLTYVSPSVIKRFGFSEEELLGYNAINLFHPDDIPALVIKRNEILDQPGAFYFFTFRVLHKSGNWIWCEGTVTNLLHDVAVQAMVSNFRDITEKRLLEEQRIFDKTNMDALMNSTHDLMWSIDRNYCLITFNNPFQQTMKNTTGLSVQKGTNLLGENFDDTLKNVYTGFYNRAFSGETFTEIIDHELNGINWSEVSFYPIYQDDTVIGTACFLRDISQRKRSEEQLLRNSFEKEQFIMELSQNNKDLKQFAYITSHNLRGPVASLLGLTNLLETFKVENATLSQILSGIQKASLSFDETIRDLNNILTIKDNVSLQNEILLFSNSFNRALEHCENLRLESKAKISADFSNAPQVKFHKAYLESIFLNLLTNALKYRDQERRLEIVVKTEENEHGIQLTFRDNGIGIDLAAHQEKIFNLYQRFHSHKEGKGLGLYLVKSQLEALGGSISIESQVNSGTLFSILFRKT